MEEGKVCLIIETDSWLRCTEIYDFNCFVGFSHNWSLDFNVDEDKDPVGDGEGGVDDGDEEEADVLDLLLRLSLPHALHQLGYLKQYMLSCLNGPFELLTVHSQMTKKMGRTQKNAQTSK